MWIATDVDYRDPSAVAAGVLFSDWRDAAPADELTVHVPEVAPYEPGSFYKRELPCLQALLSAVTVPLTGVIVDGHVWLSDDGRKGLGAHLYDSMQERLPVIGVAKTAFVEAPAVEVLRGGSARPLYVTAAGFDVAEAAALVRGMDGEHRLPTLLKRVDRLARDT